VGQPTQKAVYIALLLSARRDSPLKAPPRFVFFWGDLTSLRFNKHEDKYVAARASAESFNIERKGKSRGHEFQLKNIEME
jgi:hypothetical protein